MEWNEYYILIILSLIILISHCFNLISRISRIPSVLLLIGLGVILKKVSGYFDVDILNINNYLGFLGTIGLILIVLEGAADLKIKRQNFPIIERAFGAALVVLLVSTVAIAALFHFWLKVSIQSALINAIPFGVISSAIAIPTVENFTKHKKEFLIYEAVFSDILGIMLFNFVLTADVLNAHVFGEFAFDLVVTVIISIIGSFLLLWSLYFMKTQTRFFIILSLLVLFYCIGKILHLSSLLLVFVFGILLNNLKVIPKMKFIKRVDQEEVAQGIDQFKVIIVESAFLIRTFFFVVFGYSINIESIINPVVLMVGFPTVLILFFVRFIYLKFMAKSHIFPEIFIAPKGLVTILLFYSIPPTLAVHSFNEGGVVFFVILVTGLLMLVSGFSEKHLKGETRAAEEKSG